MYTVSHTNISLHVNAMVELTTMKTGKYQELLAPHVYKNAQMKLDADWLVHTLKQNSDRIPEELVSPMIFPLNM